MHTTALLTSLALTIFSTQVKGDFWLSNYYITSCQTVGGGCIGYLSASAVVVPTNDFSVNNMQGAKYDDGGIVAKPPTGDFTINSQGDTCGQASNLDFYRTDDSGEEWAVFLAGGDGTQQGSCWRDESQNYAGPTGCCPQTEILESVLYCQTALCS